MSRFFPLALLFVSISFPLTSAAQIDYYDECTNGQRLYPGETFYLDTMMIDGAYWLDGYQGSTERGQSFIDQNDELLVIHYDDNAGPIIRGNVVPDLETGAFTMLVAGGSLGRFGAETFVAGETMELVLCDWYGHQFETHLEPIVLMSFEYDPSRLGPLQVEPRAFSQYGPEGFGESAGKTDMLPVPPLSSASVSTQFQIQVAIHGIASGDVTGKLDVWYRRLEDDVWKDDRIRRFLPIGVTNDGHAVYNIELTVNDDAEDRQLFFTHLSIDPRDGDEHFGYALGVIPFQPQASDFAFLGNEIDEVQPWKLFLSHPPAYQVGYIGGGGGAVPFSPLPDSHFGKGTFQIDLYDGVIDPTGQKINFAVSEADVVTAELSGSVLTITHPDDWTGVDRLRLEMTHDTHELTVRYLDILGTADDSNYPDWAPLNPNDFEYAMTIIAHFSEFAEVADVTVEDGPILGAFINGELAGRSQVRVIDGRVLLFTTVYSNDPEATVDLQVYTTRLDHVYQIPGSLDMQPGASYGTIGSPFDLGNLSVGTESDELSLPLDLEISSVYLNPASGQISVDLTVPTAGDITVYMVDLLGRRQQIHHEDHVPSGRHSLTIPLNGYASGQYNLLVESGEFNDVIPFTMINE